MLDLCRLLHVLAGSLALSGFLLAGDAGPTKAELKQWEEAKQIKEAVDKLVEQTPADKRATAITQLEGLKRQFAQHAAQSYILVALGQLYEETKPDQALQCYQQAAKFPLKTDRWAAGQQRAYHALAALYEKQGKYREALEAVSNWEVGETAGRVTEAEKEIARCRVRMHLNTPEEALKGLWRDLENGKPRPSPDLPARLKMLYGPDRETELEKELATRLEMYPVPPDEKAAPETRDYYQVLMDTKAHLEFVKNLREATPEKLVALVKTVTQDDPGDLNGRPDRLLNKRIPALEYEVWRERMLLDALLAKKDQTAPLLVQAAAENSSALYACALAKASTPEALESLKQKAKGEQEAFGLRNWYFALLLTGDKTVEALLAKETQTKPKALEAAKWAVEAVRQVK